MIRLGARGYNPTIGRFDRVDPVIEGQEQLSLYHYSFNNPVRFSDADGLMGESCCQNAIDFVAGATLRFIDNNSPIPTSLDGGGYRGSAYENGRKFGDGLSLLSGGVQLITGGLGTLGAGGLELVTGGAATPIALPVGAAAIATAGNGVNTISKALSNLNSQGKSNSGDNKKSNVSSGNKNSAHANQKAREVAKEKYEKVKKEYDAAKSKANKTPEDKELEKKLEKQFKHEKQKMDNTGENHSRKAKGSN
ncbi:RHS repeat domain-containing protein [Emticicia fluvialis]|uniref:RHS repeat domain-containing protein n=1 Tax=Emticicia fluvialis TaxID=2974474 RepID=UPI002166ACAD|nr:RHS repeat-associated core domain-containing protein [Emticicia fluvialis]